MSRRNRKCPCGSGKKHRNCCGSSEIELEVDTYLKSLSTTTGANPRKEKLPKEKNMEEYKNFVREEARYVRDALLAPRVYYHYMLAELLYAMNAPNPGDSTKEFIKLADRTRAECEQAYKDSRYPKVKLFYAPVEVRKHSWASVNRQEPTVSVAGDIHLRVLENRPIPTISELNDIENMMLEDASKAYGWAQTDEGVEKYHSIVRWITSTLASRLGVSIQYSPPKDSNQIGTKVSDFIFLPPTHINELWIHELNINIFKLSKQIFCGQICSVMIPTDAIIYTNVAQKLERGSLSAHGQVDLLRSIADCWTMDDDYKLAELIGYKFSSFESSYVAEATETNFKQKVKDYLSLKFDTQYEKEADYCDLAAKESRRAIESIQDEDGVSLVDASSQELCQFYNVIKIRQPNHELPQDISKEHERHVSELLRESNFTKHSQKFVKDLLAEGSPIIYELFYPELPKLAWYEDAEERTQTCLEAADYDFLTYLDPRRKRPVECRTLFRNYADAVESELWWRVFFPAIKDLSNDEKLLDSELKKVIDDDDKEFKTRGLAKKIRECRKDEDVKKMILGEMTTIISWSRSCFEKVHLSLAESSKSPDSFNLEERFLSNCWISGFMLSFSPSSEDVFNFFRMFYRNQASHPDEVVDFNKALLGRRYAMALLQWMVETCPKSDTPISLVEIWSALGPSPAYGLTMKSTLDRFTEDVGNKRLLDKNSRELAQFLISKELGFSS